MNLKRYSKNKLSTLFCSTAVLLSGFVQTFGATEVMINPPNSSECQDKRYAPVKRYIIDTGNREDLGLQSACGFYSLEAALQIALNPKEKFLTIQRGPIIDWYQQYAKILEEYFPIIRSVVSPSFKIDGKFFTDFYNLSNFDTLERVAQFATGNLNASWRESLKGRPDNTSEDEDYEEKFCKLAKLYYGNRSPSEDYLEFRQILFAQWIMLVIGECPWLDIEEKDSENLELMSSKWNDHCGGKRCDMQVQERMYREGVQLVKNCDFGICSWSYFFTGMVQVASCGNEMLCDKFTINIFSLEPNEREVRFVRSFFDSLDREGNKKLSINIAFSSEHAECLTPDDRLRWVTYNDVYTNSQYEELTQDMNRWENLRLSLLEAERWQDTIQAKKFDLRLNEFLTQMRAKQPIVNSVVVAPNPVLIVTAKDVNIQKDFPRYLTVDDIPQRWRKNKSSHIPGTLSNEEKGFHDKLVCIKIYEDYFSLLSRMMDAAKLRERVK
ncbi:MAG: hypothetical protein LW808_003150 [Verrucomicrobiota bacterium]|nr:MAG: hypothetical protein LW808_003150 [Verrucomicrobiota bacterium]